MARSVLNSARILGSLVLCLASALACAQQPAQSCAPIAGQVVPAARQKQLHDFQNSVESGAFYQELVRRRGLPQSCNSGVDGETLSLTYAFRGGAQLEAQSNASIEFSEQRMQVSGLNKQSALNLLKAAEHSLYGEEGCGIQWERPTTEPNPQHPTSHDVVYRGSTCNCQARMLYQRKTIIALAVRGAC